MFKKILTLSLLLSTFVITNTSYANPHAADSSKASTCACIKDIKKMTKTLQLSDAQTARIKAIRMKSKEARHANKQELIAIQSQLENLADTDKMDQQALDKLVSQKMSLLAASTKARIMTRNEIYNVLTSAQQIQFKEIHQNHGKKHSDCKCKVS